MRIRASDLGSPTIATGSSVSANRNTIIVTSTDYGRRRYVRISKTNPTRSSGPMRAHEACPDRGVSGLFGPSSDLTQATFRNKIFTERFSSSL